MLFACSLACYGQKKCDESKLSLYLKNMYLENIQHTAKGIVPKQKVVCALMRLNGDAHIKEVADDYGVSIVDSIGNIYIVQIPVKRLGDMSFDKRIQRIEAHEMPRPTMDETPARVGADKAWNGEGLPQAFTGKGIITAAIDNDFNFTHPMFMDKDGNTRICRFYEATQDDEYNTTIVAHDSEEVMEMGKSDWEGQAYGHGSHVTSIMAGTPVSGEKGNYSGIAPESDVVMFEINNGFNSSATLIDFFKIIFDYADERGQPCVINMSMSGYFPIFIDATLHNEAIELLLGPGHIIVTSAGNYGDTYITKDRYKFKDYHEACILNYYAATETFIDDIILTLSTDKSQKIAFYNSRDYNNSNDTIFIDTYTLDSLNSKCFSCKLQWKKTGNDSLFIESYKVVNPPPYIKEKLYQFGVHFDSIRGFLGVDFLSDNPCYMYLYSDPLITFYYGGITTGHTIGWPASVDNVIAVGSNRTKGYYGNGLLSSFSSQGPTWTNLTKPDVVAPGEIIYAANTQSKPTVGYYDTVNDKETNEHYIAALSGTSMSSPIVAGAVALWLQAKPDLTPQEIKDILARTCKHPEDVEYPNNNYGYGEIDVYKGLLYILGVEPDAIEDITSHISDKISFRLNGRTLTVEHEDGIPFEGSNSLTVYTTQGIQVASSLGSSIDLSMLPSDVYIIKFNSKTMDLRGSTIIRL